MIKKFFISLMATGLFTLCAYGQQNLFNDAQTLKIACAKEKLYAIYNFFDTSKPQNQKAFMPDACGTVSKPIQVPAWFQEDLTSKMQARVLWEIPGENPEEKEYINEPEIWRGAIARVHDILTLAEQINDGALYSSQEIMEKLGNIRTRYLIELDRLNTNPALINYDIRESMDGRGRMLLSTLELIKDEMDSASESFVSSPKIWRSKFKKSILGIAVLSNSLYGDIVSNPAPLMPENYKKSTIAPILLAALMLLGMIAVMFFTYSLLSSRGEEISQAASQYMQKSAHWADDYSRQFLSINVRYLVFTTVGFFTFAGIFLGLAAGGMFGLILFITFFTAGLGLGIKIPGILLNFLKVRRGEKINKQLMDALILLSNSLKSGMDIVQGFDMVSRDLRPPISEEFSLVVKNYNLGTPFEKALEGMEDRVESRLLSYMVKAIILQRQVGGNLTKIFERIVENIREESKLEEKLSAMTAQQRIQAAVVGVMPWLMTSVLFVFQPSTMINFYSQFWGFIILIICIFWVIVGMKAVHKLGEIRV